MDGDDVYNSDYKLTPLQKLEKYMQSENVYTRSVQCPELDFVNPKTLYLKCNLFIFSNDPFIMFIRQMVARGLLDTLRAVEEMEEDVFPVFNAMVKLSQDSGQ